VGALLTKNTPFLFLQSTLGMKTNLPILISASIADLSVTETCQGHMLAATTM